MDDEAAPKLSPYRPAHDRRLRFVDEYLANGFDASKAYMSVYNCDEASARSHCGRVLSEPDVAAYLETHRAAAYKRIGISHERVLQELQRLALVDTADFYDAATGQLLPIHTLPEDSRRAITGVKHDREGNVIGYEIESKRSALELLAKIGAMVVERSEVISRNDTTVRTSPEIEDRIAMLVQKISSASVFQ